MSRAVFDYSELKDAAKKADKTADQLDDYTGRLNKKVSTRLQDYGGPSSGNVSLATGMISLKMKQLNEKAEAFRTFSAGVTTVIAEAKSTDEGVQRTISQLTGDFKTRHGIETGFFDWLGTQFNTLLNQTSFGRWVNNGLHDMKDWFSKTGRDIKVWYKYEGGKYILTENLKALLVVAVSVIGAVAAILTAGGIVAIIAAVAATVLAIIAVADFISTVTYNNKAADAMAEDPVLAARLNKVDGLSEELRLSYNSADHTKANILDTVEVAAMVTSVVCSGISIFKKGYKWLTSGKDFSFTKGGWTSLKEGLKGRWSSAKQQLSLLKAGDGQAVRSMLSGYASKLWRNIKDPFGNLGQIATGESFKDVGEGLKSLKAIVSIPKDLMTADSFLSGVVSVSLDTFVFSGIAINGEFGGGSPDLVSVSDIKSKLVDKSIKAYETGSRISSGENPLAGLQVGSIGGFGNMADRLQLSFGQVGAAYVPAQ